MNQAQFLLAIEQSYKEGLEIVKKKNADYAEDADPFKNFRNSTMAGVTLEQGILVRVMDKLTRVANLLDKDAQVTDESVDDTLLDLINYVAILRVYRKDKYENRSER